MFNIENLKLNLKKIKIIPIEVENLNSELLIENY